MSEAIAKFESAQPFIVNDKIVLNVLAATDKSVILSDEAGVTVTVDRTENFKVGKKYAELKLEDDQYAIAAYISKPSKRTISGSGSMPMYKTNSL